MDLRLRTDKKILQKPSSSFLNQQTLTACDYKPHSNILHSKCAVTDFTF